MQTQTEWMPVLSVLLAWTGEYGDATPLFSGLCGLAFAICGIIGLLPGGKRPDSGAPPVLEQPAQDRPDRAARLLFSLLKQVLLPTHKQADVQQQLKQIVERRRLPHRQTGAAAPWVASAQDVPEIRRQPKHLVLVSVLFLVVGVFLMISAYQEFTS